MSSTNKEAQSPALARSLLLGGVQLVTAGIGLIKTKAAAVMLGPVGVGLYGTYINLIDFIATVTGLGLSNSGVRQVAESGASADPRHAHEVAVSLHRVLWVIGIVGTLTFVLLAKSLSILTFDDASRSTELMLVAPCLLFSNLFIGHTAILRGRSQVAKLSRLMVMASVADAAVVLSVLYLASVHTVPLALAASFLTKALIARVTSEPAGPDLAPVSWATSLRIGRDMLAVGMGFLVSSLVFTGVTYLIRREVALDHGLVSLGHYSAAYGLAYIFISFIVAGIVSGFYPIAVAHFASGKELQAEFSEQLLAGIMLAGPIVAFAALARDWVIMAAYSGDFSPAAAPLRWFLLGCLIRVVHAPMSYVVIALRKPVLFALTEVAFGAMGLGLAWLLLPAYGVEGAGLAFAANMALNALLLGALLRFRNGLRIRREEGLLLALALAAALLSACASPGHPILFASALVADIVLLVHTARLARRRLSPEHRVNRLLNRLRIP